MDKEGRYRVLVVEDDQASAELLQEALMTELSKRLPILFFHKESPSKADVWLQQMLPEKPDLLILDLKYLLHNELNQLREGLAWLKKLRDENSPFKDCPVIVYSGSPDFEDFERAKALGVEKFIQKGVDPFTKLEEAIESVLTRPSDD